MATLNGLFDTFLSNIEPDEDTRKDAVDAHTPIRKWLAEHDDFGKIHLDTFLAGSYARQTSVTPIKDVDIVVVCSMDAYDKNPKVLLNRLKKALDDSKKYKTKTSPRRRSIQVELPRIDMDIVPTVAPNGVDNPLRIPDRDVETWFDTNPKGHIAWTQQLNAATKQNDKDRGRYVPLVKMARWWRTEQLGKTRHPKGFMVELCVGAYHDSKTRAWADVFIAWIERSIKGLQPFIDLKTVPQFNDPGLPGQTIKSGMEWADFERFFNRLSAAQPIAERARALGATDLRKSAKEWQKLFGSEFELPDDDDGLKKSTDDRGSGPSVLKRPTIVQAPTFG